MASQVKISLEYFSSTLQGTPSCSSHSGTPLNDLGNVVSTFSKKNIFILQVKIVDNNGAIVPINTMGELHFRGFPVFLYYLCDEEKTKQATDENGWLLSGYVNNYL